MQENIYDRIILVPMDDMGWFWTKRSLKAYKIALSLFLPWLIVNCSVLINKKAVTMATAFYIRFLCTNPSRDIIQTGS